MKNKFTKQDLKPGMVVKFRNGTKGILINNRFVTEYDINNYCTELSIHQYKDNLLEENDNINWDIVEVFELNDNFDCMFIDILRNRSLNSNLTSIWSTESNIDWSKVPKFTKVLVSKYGNDIWEKAYFIGLEDNLYVATLCDKFTFNNKNKERHCNYYDYIQLFDENDMKEEWSK